MKHTLKLTELLDYLQDENFYTYHYTFIKDVNKKLQIQIGGTKLRVLNGQEIVYEGFDPQRAVDSYNSIGVSQDSGVKIDN